MIIPNSFLLLVSIDLNSRPGSSMSIRPVPEGEYYLDAVPDLCKELDPDHDEIWYAALLSIDNGQIKIHHYKDGPFE